MSIKARNLEAIKWLINLTAGLYVFYWVVAVAHDLSKLEDENLPYQQFLQDRVGWPLILWKMPILLICEVLILIDCVGRAGYRGQYMIPYTGIVAIAITFILLIILVMIIQIFIIFTFIMRVGRALHGYLDLEFSFRRDLFKSLIDWECFIVKWQRRINESLETC